MNDAKQQFNPLIRQFSGFRCGCPRIQFTFDPSKKSHEKNSTNTHFSHHNTFGKNHGAEPNAGYPRGDH